MPVLVVENRAGGNRAYATLNEGLGKVLRYGAYAPDVLDRLRWFRDVARARPRRGAPARRAGSTCARLIAQAVQMGDECHNRNRAASALLIKALAPPRRRSTCPAAERARILAFAAGNDHFFLNVGMAACKAALDAAHGVPGSSLVTAMARNGTDFGIRVSGLGDRWFTGPARDAGGPLLPRLQRRTTPTPTSATARSPRPRASAASPWPPRRPSSSSSAARRPTRSRYTRLMYEITLGESAAYRLPALDFRGTPTGIDVRLVVQTGILPQINTGIAHRRPGIGQIGAGRQPPDDALLVAHLPSSECIRYAQDGIASASCTPDEAQRLLGHEFAGAIG